MLSRSYHIGLKVSFVLFAIITLSIVVYIVISRASIYNYDTALDYNYNFTSTDAEIYTLEIKHTQIKLPEIDISNTSIFIKLKIESDILGNILLPKVIISSSKETISHQFEYGAKGVRYLNITSVVKSGVGTINIYGDNVNINDDNVELIIFKNIDLNNSTTLVIAPHPDDAEIASFGLYSKFNENTYIVTVTAGEAGYFKERGLYDDIEDYSIDKGKIRTWNSLTVPLLGGIKYNNTLNLGFFDSTLEQMYIDDTAISKPLYIDTTSIDIFRKFNFSILNERIKGRSNWVSLVKNLKIIIEEIKPNIIVTPYPLIDSHLDHKYSTVAVLQALKELNINDGSLFLYTNHLTINSYYPFGKEGDPITLPPYFSDNLSFSSIYSFQLDKKTQINKIFALDAMNDLRLPTKWRNSFGISKIAIKTILDDITGENKSYFRRAVRSNELFFVMPINNETIEKISSF